ncbi:MAG: threonine--tRNA ligase [Blastocatellia bacterium]|nr:threonine--tRNA ligase [Blastocatellia bacterium]
MSDIQNSSANPMALDLLKQQDREAAKKALAARLYRNDVLQEEPVDLSYRVQPGERVEALTPEAGNDALEVYRHSTAHLLAAAVLDLYPGTKLGIGPALLDDPKGGFYYDFQRPEGERFTPEDLPKIEKRMKDLIKRNLEYRRVEMSKEEAGKKFAELGEPLKCELIEEKAGALVSCYTIEGTPFVDFCLGPHIPSTNRIKAIKLLSIAGAHWKGDEKREQMQRIYGTSFFSQEDLDEWVKQKEEAEKRDHRRIGPELDLFSFSEAIGPGLVLWHPNGALIRKVIEQFLNEELYRRGYSFVNTPHVTQSELFRISGHLEHYQEGLYPPMTDKENEQIEYRMKPMNCPFHIQIYKARQRSYRDLPQRYAEYGMVYRYERSGVTHGLMRARGFTQDDAHLFCTPEQLKDEVLGCLQLVDFIFKAFGFDYKAELSVRHATDHEKYLGSDEVWNLAEAALTDALQEFGLPYVRMEDEAAFYGPKIDFKVVDAIKRTWQLSTIQVDFNLPQRFGIEYIGSDNKAHQPIMVHRAILGSFERFFGILIEHYAGAFPVWLAPTQAVVLPISDRFNDRAAEVERDLQAAGHRVAADLRSEKIGAKIRDAQLKKIPFMLVIGEREAESGTVAVRDRVKGDTGAAPVAEFSARLKELVGARALQT